jgi:hypothetical protein
VLEDGAVRRTTEGSPQGGVISPLLSNIYLHEVLDVWFENDVKPRMQGRCSMFRYADDAVLVFSTESDARRVLEVLPKRFEKYGLQLHPEKTRLVHFVPPSRQEDKGGGGGGGQQGSFDFLGFTHHWGKSQRGYDVVKQKTAKNRLSRSLRRISDWCRRHRHRPIAEQALVLSQKMLGHYGYYGVTGNNRCLSNFADQVRAIWRKWLDRRSWRSRMPFERFHRLLDRYPLPGPRIVHSYVAKS